MNNWKGEVAIYFLGKDTEEQVGATKYFWLRELQLQVSAVEQGKCWLLVIV